MLITSQRVRSDRTGDQGINTFVYEHGGLAWPEEPSQLLDDDQGALVFRSYEVPPGGNQVRSYLDIVTPDRPTRFQIEALWRAIPVWFLPTPTSLPMTVQSESTACRLGMDLGLVRIWRRELTTLLDHARTCLLSYPGLQVSSRSRGLSLEEVAALVGAAGRGDTAVPIHFCRELAHAGRIDEMVEAIDIYADSCEVNKGQVRRFLAARIPGILANHFFTELGPARFNAFVEWSLARPGWGDEIIQATKSGRDLNEAVYRIIADLDRVHPPR